MDLSEFFCRKIAEHLGLPPETITDDFIREYRRTKLLVGDTGKTQVQLEQEDRETREWLAQFLPEGEREALLAD